MPLAQKVVCVPSIVAYTPPLGYRVVSIRQLEDGSYEVTLEPWALPSRTSGVEAVAAASILVMIVILIRTMLSTIKR